MPGPLAGVRVIDLTVMLAGPYTTMLLADLGAQVVKIEPPHGDATRAVGPYREGDGPEGLSGYFQSVNRGKQSVVLDLKTEAGREKLRALVRVADVFVENYSAGAIDRLGLGYETLRTQNPRLVYAAVRGFGDPRTGDSPYRDWPAYDVVAQAMGGLLGITGTVDGTPVKTGPGVGDVFPGTLLAVGLLAALHHAERTGQGQFVDVAMYDAMLSLCERVVHQYSYTGEVPVQQGNAHPLLCPFDILPAMDGWVALAANDGQWTTVAHAIGRPDMATDARYATNRARVRHRAEVREALEKWFATRTIRQAVEVFGGRVPIGPVNTAADIFADPHAAARGMLVPIEQPGSDEPVTVAGPAIKLTETPSAVRGRGPLLGEHDIDRIIAAWTSAG
ncbi:CaiB/BaiF CoA-transferase family protein [Streptomyces sp. BV129]|uniref:CaiB/BaiF CoA transferase family protein n=1 Tax=Streptomyces sp. BV129 TaxID=2849671 RepID=UPI001C2EC139|nr:CoA transferase [Streptomyces sp. BV129]MBV1949058.1 CoA transferase [Streptomyces sp. BV129]